MIGFVSRVISVENAHDKLAHAFEIFLQSSIVVAHGSLNCHFLCGITEVTKSRASFA